jgi:N-acetylated-alpha-linked acidic dipeptidase
MSANNEYTPLLTTVRVSAPRRRYPHNVLRRFCTIALSSILIWSLIALAICLFVFPQPDFPHHNDDGSWSWPGCKGRRVTYDELKDILVSTPSSQKLEDWSRYYTSGPHLAGQNFSQVCLPCLPPEVLYL